eukprot:365706-Chlamydomonas_euryale.AAC.6
MSNARSLGITWSLPPVCMAQPSLHAWRRLPLRARRMQNRAGCPCMHATCRIAGRPCMLHAEWTGRLRMLHQPWAVSRHHSDMMHGAGRLCMSNAAWHASGAPLASHSMDEADKRSENFED